MTLPKSVHIAGVPVKIVREDLSDENGRSKGYFGYYSHERKTIVVDSNLKPAEVKATVRHEMLHACFAFSGLDRLDTFAEESVVVCLEELFFGPWERFCKRFKA